MPPPILLLTLLAASQRSQNREKRSRWMPSVIAGDNKCVNSYNGNSTHIFGRLDFWVIKINVIFFTSIYKLGLVVLS